VANPTVQEISQNRIQRRILQELGGAGARGLTATMIDQQTGHEVMRAVVRPHMEMLIFDGFVTMRSESVSEEVERFYSLTDTGRLVLQELQAHNLS
jgi:hypothetical protein